MFREQIAIFYQIFKSGSSKKIFQMSAIYKGDLTVHSRAVLYGEMGNVHTWRKLCNGTCIQACTFAALIMTLLSQNNRHKNTGDDQAASSILSINQSPCWLPSAGNCRGLNSIQLVRDATWRWAQSGSATRGCSYETTSSIQSSAVKRQATS